jgi:hypothetical protein
MEFSKKENNCFLAQHQGRRTVFATSLFFEVRFLCYLLLKLLPDRYFQLGRVRLDAQGRI